ncbi:MAG: GNAT family N-acetyltransferase [Candidatus Nanopelagicales bacterium]
MTSSMRAPESVSSMVRVRSLRDSESAEFNRIDQLAFGYTPETEDHPDAPLLDHRRSLVAELDDQVVGIASSFPLALSVPGGALVPTAGVTWVGVLPTHRRRGVVRAIMEHQLRSLQAGGEPLAALWASEPAIYGRFGYGMASRALHVHVPSRSGMSRAPEDPSLRVRLVTPADARPSLATAYAAAAARRPGMPSRSEAWWDRTLHDPAERRAGASELRVLLAEDEHRPRGYALFATKQSWGDDHNPKGRLKVRELVSVDISARAALWKTLLEHDLMATVDWINAPLDDPILIWADNIRPVVRAVLDQLWVRILDLPGALTARAYQHASTTVIEVHDPLLEANSGRWRLVTSPVGSALCERTAEPADVVLDVRDLGAVYLGSTELAQLAAAGLVVANDPAVLNSLSTALHHRPAAWCPNVF